MLYIGESTKGTNRKNGRCVTIDQENNAVELAMFKDDEQVDGKIMIINTRDGEVFVGVHRTNEECKQKHADGVIYKKDG